MVLIVAARNISQNASAAETYTGTNAREMNLDMEIFSICFSILDQLHLKNKLSAKTGEKIAYSHNIVAREKSAKTIAISSTPNITKNNSPKVSFFAISQAVLSQAISVESMTL